MELKLPREYERFVTEFGGKDADSGEPRYCLWFGSMVNHKMALPPDFFVPYLDHFCLLKWYSRALLGTEEQWMEEWGPYPQHGGYLPLWLFKDPKTGGMIPLDSPDLNKTVIAYLIWLDTGHEHDSLMERVCVKGSIEDLKKAGQMSRIADYLQDRFPEFGDACSFTGQTNCNSALKQKIEVIERNMHRIWEFKKRRPLSGPSISPAEQPRLITHL
jgi:hypothetical protein